MKNFALQAVRLPSPSSWLLKGALLLGTITLGQWFLGDVIHLPGGGIGSIFLVASIFFLSKPLVSGFKSPTSVKGWVKRLNSVLDDFDALEDDQTKSKQSKIERLNELDKVLTKNDPQSLGIVGATGVKYPDKSQIETAMSGSIPLNISWSSPLPLKDNSWSLPTTLYEQDVLLYLLPLPLRAADLLWIEKLSEDQPAWLIVTNEESSSWPEQLKVLDTQLPERWLNRILRVNTNDYSNIRNLMSPIRKILSQPKRNRAFTKQRLLSKLHSSWQSDLEQLRRKKFRHIQSRAQWVVAGAVFASPVPSTDLLSLAVVNGLMMQEMAEIWSCSWKPETLKVVGRQLAGVAMAQGVVEWSGNALLGVAKLHGGGWLAAGTMQALSAAYLTRVVGRSMSDWMALNNGVAEPDLEALKLQAPKLVENAAKQERVDWSDFLSQAKSWIGEKHAATKIQTTLVEGI